MNTLKVTRFKLTLLTLLLSVTVDVFGKESIQFIPELGKEAKVIELNPKNKKYIDAVAATNLYRSLLSKVIEKNPLEHPKVLKFFDGNQYLLERSIGRGSLTFVFKAKNLKTNKTIALRIPQSTGNFKYYNQWASYQPQFQELKYPVPKMIHSVTNQYTEVELLDIKFTLADLLQEPEKIDPEVVNNAVKAYEVLLKQTKGHSSFEDNKPQNLSLIHI